jgi:hypothetical protein
MLGPDFAWMSQAVPTIMTLLLVSSWYERPRVGPQIMFKATR